MKASKNILFIIFMILVSAGFTPAMAQSGNPITQQELLLIVALALILIVAILVLIVALYMVIVLKTILQKEQLSTEQETEEAKEKKPSFWSRFSRKVHDAVPVEEEESIMLDHDYDGIRELDNHLPPWWKWLFYFTIITAVVYLFLYHVIDVLPLQHEEYVQELERAEEMRAQMAATGEVETIDINNPEISTDESDIMKGQNVFKTNCISCHQADGGGGIGPNLTDQYWLHGGSFKNIFTTIHDGVDGTSMIAWKNVLTPVEIRNVASFVTTLRGTEPANPKEPQGELYQPEPEPEAPKDTVSADSAKVVENI